MLSSRVPTYQGSQCTILSGKLWVGWRCVFREMDVTCDGLTANRRLFMLHYSSACPDDACRVPTP